MRKGFSKLDPLPTLGKKIDSIEGAGMAGLSVRLQGPVVEPQHFIQRQQLGTFPDSQERFPRAEVATDFRLPN